MESSQEASSQVLQELSAKLRGEYEQKLLEEQRKHREEIENLQVCILCSLFIKSQHGMSHSGSLPDHRNQTQLTSRSLWVWTVLKHLNALLFSHTQAQLDEYIRRLEEADRNIKMAEAKIAERDQRIVEVERLLDCMEKVSEMWNMTQTPVLWFVPPARPHTSVSTSSVHVTLLRFD